MRSPLPPKRSSRAPKLPSAPPKRLRWSLTEVRQMPGFQAAVPAFGPALPEILLAVGALILVLVGAIRGDKSAGLVTWLALGLLAVVGILVWRSLGTATAITFNGSFVVDGFARFMK